MQIKKVPVKDLVSPDWNPRQITTEELEKLKTSLEEFGYIEPIIVNDVNNHVVGGNQRLRALIALGYDEVDCVYVHIEDINKEKACNVALNKISGDWDEDKLRVVLEDIELSPIDIKLTGFDELELTSLDLGEETETEYSEPTYDVKEDDYKDEDIIVTVQEGELYRLGNHRLYCGDATKEESYQILCQDIPMDLVFTDPPYGMKKQKDGVMNDNLNYDDLLEFNKQWIPLTFQALKSNGSWYCWGTDEPLMDIYSHILKPLQKQNKLTFRNLITWDKGSGQGQMNADFKMYPIADEKCLFIQMGINCLTLNAEQYWEEYEPIRLYLLNERKKCGWDIPTMKRIAGHSDMSRDHWTSKSQWNLPTKEVYQKFQEWARKNNVQAFEKEYEELRAEYEELRAYFNNTHDNMNNVWHFKRTSNTEKEMTGGHATPKPIALCSRAILSSSRQGENILDVFGGSGSTLIACEQLNRQCYMMELDPYYCQVIINRWEEYTGRKAEKLPL